MSLSVTMEKEGGNKKRKWSSFFTRLKEEDWASFLFSFFLLNTVYYYPMRTMKR